eukprot:1139419-Pelagomonas_calceolata.AAC.7
MNRALPKRSEAKLWVVEKKKCGYQGDSQSNTGCRTLHPEPLFLMARMTRLEYLAAVLARSQTAWHEWRQENATPVVFSPKNVQDSLRLPVENTLPKKRVGKPWGRHEALVEIFTVLLIH